MDDGSATGESQEAKVVEAKRIACLSMELGFEI